MGNCKTQPIRVAPLQSTGSPDSPSKRTTHHTAVGSSHNESDSMHSSVHSNTTLTQRAGGGATSARLRPASMSRKSAKMGGGMYFGMAGGTIKSSGAGRPISRNDSLNSSWKEDRLKKATTTVGGGMSVGLNQSQNSSTQRQNSFPLVDPHPFELSCSDESNTVLLRNNGVDGYSAIKCPSCSSQFTKIVHVPYLLMCGHTFCSNCIDMALRTDPSYLKCGMCSINTSVQPQSESKDLVLNEPILELIDNKHFGLILSNSMFDRCAECEKAMAIVYCSECSASLCEECNHKEHTGSRVRSKHKPVPINLKPRPQPTCKRHPGQSCVLYCETERQPMCVLCKFYGHHKFHNYQLLNNSSTAYQKSLTEKLAQAEKIESSLSRAAQNLTNSKRQIKTRAIEAQEKLERSFEELKEELIAALEQREATLLVLLDRQVQKREEIIEDEQEEVAFARARAIAAIEEAKKLSELNPVSALLARKHMDKIIDTVLKQTAIFPEESTDTDPVGGSYDQLMPLGLNCRPKQEVSQRMSQTLEQHGAILQLPGKPEIVSIKIHKESIHIKWKLLTENDELPFDRTMSYSLNCFADVPLEFKKNKILNFNKRFQNQLSGRTPDSGFKDEESDRSSQASENRPAGPSLPSLLPSLPTNNVSLVTLQETSSTPKISIEPTADSVNDSKTENTLRPLLSNSILTSAQGVTPAAGGSSTHSSMMRDSLQTSAAILNLPPLLKTPVTGSSTQHTLSAAGSDMYSSSTSDISADDQPTGNEETQPVKKVNTNLRRLTENDSTGSSGSIPTTANTTATSAVTATDSSNVTDVGRFSKGFAFEEIYSGKDTSFRYTGVVKGATYYFRIRCHNAAGFGLWSNTYKCNVLP